MIKKLKITRPQRCRLQGGQESRLKHGGGVLADFSLRKKERGINSAKTSMARVLADFSLREKERGINSAKTSMAKVVANFSSRRKKRGLKSAKTAKGNVLADFSLRRNARRLKSAKTWGSRVVADFSRRRFFHFLRALFRFFRPPAGSLSWRRVFKLSGKNLLRGRSRTVVTAGGMGVGVGAIVLLVSFGYGLQAMVTSRIIWPEALRVADATSESASVFINKEMIEKIEAVAGVAKAEPAIRLAGQVGFGGSKVDAVVVGATNEYLHLGNLRLLKGDYFSAAADKRFLGRVEVEKELTDAGFVKGVASDMDLARATASAVAAGDKAGERVSFRLRDEAYIPVYAEPKTTAPLLGFVRGSILQTYRGNQVWGGIYKGPGGQGRVIAGDGAVFGRWLEAVLPLWEKMGDGVYQPKKNENGGQASQKGYLTFEDAKVLSREEKMVEKILDSGGLVLGEATASGLAAAEASEAAAVKSGTESAGLAAVLAEDKKEAAGTEDKTAAVLHVWPDSRKEVLVSEALARAWGKKPAEVVGRVVNVRYLVAARALFAGGDRPAGMAGRVFSEVVDYRIAGVFKEDKKPLIYVPLGDVESMGVGRYSAVRVLADKEADLPLARTMIQNLGLVTRSVADTLTQINRLFRVVRFLLGSFGAIALVVALFGMFNTLTVSLLERTREIGVMKSLGTTNFDVRRIFLTEAILISLAGGVLGVLLGGGLGWLVNRFVFHFSRNGHSLFILPWPFALAIVAVSILVGAATGWYPSRRAARISALDALRYE